MNEVTAFSTLKNNIRLLADRIERIENGLGSGMPDSNYCLSGCEGWIEIKAPSLPVREDTRVIGGSHPISLDQANWFLAQCNAGGRCWLFVATESAYVLIAGGLVAADCEWVNNMTLSELIDESAWFALNPVKDKKQWRALREVLRGKC